MAEAMNYELHCVIDKNQCQSIVDRMIGPQFRRSTIQLFNYGLVISHLVTQTVVLLPLARRVRFLVWNNQLSGCVPVELAELWVEKSGLERCESEEGETP